MLFIIISTTLAVALAVASANWIPHLFLHAALAHVAGVTHAGLPAHLGRCRTGRRTCSSRSGRAATAGLPGSKVAAAA